MKASPVAPIGVCLRQEGGGHLVDRAWVFPYRVGSLTEYLIPDQFGVYESMRARRAAALLTSIAADHRNRINLDFAPTRFVFGTALAGASLFVSSASLFM
ncbi:MAG: hypothetical protein OHK0013_28560 [Sandaracinaceae bacterium]